MPRQPNTSTQTLLLLEALLSRDGEWRYGYDLSRQTGLKSGTLYPILMRLEAQGLLETSWADAEQPGRPPRHLYRLTATGTTAAHEALSTVQAAKPHAGRLRPSEGVAG
jgi:DNA-binding PadR family transcriptional regulator